jgi:small subunit ribosomal protein S20
LEAETHSVATHKSAEKRARQDARRRERNRVVKSRAKTTVKALRAELDAGSAGLREKLRETESVLRKAASRGVIPKRRASRLVSRLAKRVAKAKSKT